MFVKNKVKSLFLVITFLMMVSQACSSGTSAEPTGTPKLSDTPPEEDFALDLINTITELNILNFHNKNLRDSFLRENDELRRAEEDYFEIQRLVSEPDPDIDRLEWLLADLNALTGVQGSGDDQKIIDQERYDCFVAFLAAEAFYNYVDQSTVALNLLVGTDPNSVPGYSLSDEALTQIFEPKRVEIKDALRDGDWSEEDHEKLGLNREDALKWANSFDEYLGEINKLIEKGQSHPDQITTDDLLELREFQYRLIEALASKIGLEVVGPKVEKVEGTNQLNVTIEGGEAGLLQNLSFRMEENGISEKKQEGKRFVFVRMEDNVYAWKIIDEGNYDMVKRIQAKIHSGK